MQEPHPTPDPAALKTSDMPGTDPVVPVGETMTGREPSLSRNLWPLALAAGLAAGLLSWGCGEITHGRFQPNIKDVPASMRGNQVTLTPYWKMLTEVGYRKRSALAYGTLGASLGLAMGLAGGLARRSAGGALLAGLVGLLLGAGAGAGASSGLVPRYYQMIDRASEADAANNMVPGLLMHAGVWGAVGLAVGLALGLGTGGRDRTVLAAIGGGMGALLGAFVYEFVGILVFPFLQTGMPLASGPVPRLMAHVAVAVFTAAGATLAAQDLTLTRAARPSA